MNLLGRNYVPFQIEIIILSGRRFELEEQRTGACVDYLNFYDGASTGSSKINAQPYCDRTGPHNVSSSSTSMTLEFVTDGSAGYRGFDIIFAAVTNGNQTLRNNGDNAT